jgi:5'-nucleotidase
MPYSLENKLVVAVASSALFDLAESDRVFQMKGVEAYRDYQLANEDVVLNPGVAFPLIRRLQHLNEGIAEPLVEVILLSRNDPNTGLRVMNSIDHHKLGITRAVFVRGGNPFRYMASFNASLFLSASPDDVRRAVEQGLPAGRVFPTAFVDREDDMELRIAFDFDGVVADDSAERVFDKDGLEAFHASELQHATEALKAGPLANFFSEIARLQRAERERQGNDQSYEPRLRTAIVTARNAPAHKRVVTTLREWGIEVDEVFFLGGIEKSKVLQEFKPHIFFDDQLLHIEGVAGATPSAHVPFGIKNQPSPELILEADEEHERRKDDERSGS